MIVRPSRASGNDDRRVPKWPTETDDPLYADRRNFYKVEKWSRDGLRVELMLYAGNSLETARRIFERTSKNRPRIRLTMRQRMRVLNECPRHETILWRRRRDRGELRQAAQSAPRVASRCYRVSLTYRRSRSAASSLMIHP
jgi:hypothetical protein